MNHPRLQLVACCLLLAAHAAAEAPMGVSENDGATTFRVWAPHAESVAVIGEFNNWKAMQGEHLAKDDGSGIWTLTLKRSLPRGAYEFLINGNLRRRDPYARAVTSNGEHSLFHDTSSFSWEGERAPVQRLEDMVIYEMHIGSFFDPRPADGMPATFADAARKLSYLVDLGVTTLCLLPVHAFDGNHSWGYNPSDPFAVEQAYGGPDGLKAFVKSCHARGLAVHLDIVHNHYGPQNLDLLQFDGTGSPDNGGIYFYDGEGIGMTPWGPRLRYEDPMVRRYVRDNAMMWLEEYRVDGFRWDSTINIRAHSFGANPIPEGSQMLEEINREIAERFPGRWSIAEDSLDIGNFHASWDYDFHHQVMPVLSASDDAARDMRLLANAIGRMGGMKRVVYIDNHDEAGKINGMLRIASDIDPRNPGSDRARAVSGLGALLTFTAPGIPLLFMGNEFQEYGTFHDDLPLDWGKVSKHAGLLALHRDLIALRRNLRGATPGLTGWDVRIPATDDNRKTMVYWRSSSSAPEDVVVVAVNISSQAADVVIPFPSAGPWILRLNTDNTTYGGSSRSDNTKPFTLNATPSMARTTLAPFSGRIYSLAVRPATGRAAASVTPAAAPSDHPPFSMYAAIHLCGDFNGWSKTDAPFRLVADNTWEGRFTFEQPAPAFTLSANEDGVIFWGGHYEGAPVREGVAVNVKRLGGRLRGEGLAAGSYLFRFNEEALTLVVTPAQQNGMESPTPDSTPAVRVWTDTRGKILEATLQDASDAEAVLVRENGQTVRIPVDRLSEADRRYILDWRTSNGK